MNTEVLDQQLSYLVTLLPVSRLNRPDIIWQLEPGEPRRLVLRRTRQSYLFDEFCVYWSYAASGWEVSLGRYYQTSDQQFRTADVGATPLRDNYLDIAALTTLVSKMEQHFAPAAQVVTGGTMCFDPVEGESDYVKRCECTCGQAAD